MSDKTVLVVGARFDPLDIEMEVLSPLGATLVRTPGQSEEELAAACSQGAPAILAAAHPRFTRRVLAAARGLKWIVRYGIGVDQIDVATARELGITVCNVPDASTTEVALHATALVLALVRRLGEAALATRAGAWNLAALKPMHSLESMRVGVVGLGKIGRTTARNLAALGFAVCGFDPYIPAESFAGEPFTVCDSFAALARECDVLTLHLPATEQTRGMIDDDVLGQMKPGAYLVNVSRGELIDEAALEHALATGHLGGAALDVLCQEPPSPDHPLRHNPRVILTPHAAWYTVQAEARLRQLAAEEVARALRGEPPLHPVNA